MKLPGPCASYGIKDIGRVPGGMLFPGQWPSLLSLFFGVLNPVGFDLFLDIGSQDLTKR